MKLYPLKFNPVFSYRIWAGTKLKTVLKKQYLEENIGESWEISDVDNYQTFVSEGVLKGKSLKDLTHQFKEALVGKKVYEVFGENFPLLIKFIDAKRPLSIQVHPNNSLAKERHNSLGKNEMWYVMQAEENAELIVGFNQQIDKENYQGHLNKVSLTTILNTEKVEKGDAFYIPSGRVHAIGSGVLLAEIQQTSNITYRIYDYDRIDKSTGKKRELHTELAIDAIDFKHYNNYRTSYSIVNNVSNKLVHSPYFKTNIIAVKTETKKDYSNLDSFVIYMCVEGAITLEIENKEFTLAYGETILIPAIINTVIIKSIEAKVLEVYF